MRNISRDLRLNKVAITKPQRNSKRINSRVAKVQTRRRSAVHRLRNLLSIIHRSRRQLSKALVATPRLRRLITRILNHRRVRYERQLIRRRHVKLRRRNPYSTRTLTRTTKRLLQMHILRSIRSSNISNLRYDTATFLTQRTTNLRPRFRVHLRHRPQRRHRNLRRRSRSKVETNSINTTMNSNATQHKCRTHRSTRRHKFSDTKPTRSHRSLTLVRNRKSITRRNRLLATLNAMNLTRILHLSSHNTNNIHHNNLQRNYNTIKGDYSNRSG